MKLQQVIITTAITLAILVFNTTTSLVYGTTTPLTKEQSYELGIIDGCHQLTPFNKIIDGHNHTTSYIQGFDYGFKMCTSGLNPIYLNSSGPYTENLGHKMFQTDMESNVYENNLNPP
jgi:hypothetical protein